MSKRDLLQWKVGEKVAQVDADVLLYSCAFAAQKTQWAHPEFKLGTFDSKKELNDWCAVHNHDTTLARGTVIPEPFSHAKRAYDMTLAKVLKSSEADRSITYLTGKKNFRLDVCPDYKANRKHVAKPHHYAQLREHIEAQPNTIVVNGMEADDAMGIAQYSSHAKTGSSQWSVICTIDKDLDMIKGMHYNWGKDDLYYQAGGDADLFFYRQLITGDATDNIKGIPKKGKVSAEAALPSVLPVHEMYELVRGMYYDWWYKESAQTPPILPRATLTRLSNEDLNKNAQLLWIMRHPTKHWEPPTKPKVTPL